MSNHSLKDVEFVKIQGKFYPMVYSFGAKQLIAQNAKVIMKLTEIKKIFSNKKADEELSETKIESGADVIGSITLLAEILIGQGCKYMNIYMPHYIAKENSAVNEDGKWTPISAEDIAAGVIDEEDFKKLSAKIFKLIKNGNGKIKTQSTQKNQKATHRM